MTPTLRALLAQYQATLPPEHVREWLEHITGISVRYQAQLEAVPQGPERARKLHALMEEAMADLGGAKPSCRAGCGACCHLEIEILPEEGALLAERIKAGHVVDRARLATQAARARKSPAWAAMQTVDNRCVFLGPTGSCTVYADRPASCRKLLVVSDPVECLTPEGAVQPITIPLAEILLSTVISLPGASYLSLSKAVTLGLEASAADAAAAPA
jgi:hypothetical protein